MKSKALLMKRTFAYFVFFAFALISFSACKKDSGSISGGGDYYMKFKRDGKEIKMTYTPQALFADVSSIGLYNGTFEAFTSDGKTTMILIIYDPSPVAAGKTYTQDYLSTASLPQAQLAYTDETTTGYSSGSTILNPDASTTVSISDRTDTYIKGTFSGKLLTSDYKGIKYNITDGEFYLKIVK
ncbi:hypothetical protein SAMN05444277_11747 [Parafilimonas terrae]|jgi:hypothetical protein|uniref:Uncharacterized protein n=2 Tax=Parafilimonas terrae TaxID=1465490 RepID=A0A1I5Z7D8_9BACT|nr:hypothetical protein SAMN05444277_11747 [Parafilimonas terrae]